MGFDFKSIQRFKFLFIGCNGLLKQQIFNFRNNYNASL